MNQSSETRPDSARMPSQVRGIRPPRNSESVSASIGWTAEWTAKVHVAMDHDGPALSWKA